MKRRIKATAFDLDLYYVTLHNVYPSQLTSGVLPGYIEKFYRWWGWDLKVIYRLLPVLILLAHQTTAAFTASSFVIAQSPRLIVKHSLPTGEDTLQFYLIESNGVHKQFEWKPPRPAKLSEPLYVGAPRYLFELDATHQAESYAQFKQQYQNRSPLIYVISSDGHLWGLNHQGEMVQEVSLKKEESSLEQSGLATLTSMDAFWANRWHTVLVGVIPSSPMKLFAKDITVLDGKLNSGENLLWQISLPEGAVAHKPIIARFADDSWGVIFSYIIGRQAYIAFVDMQSGQLFKEIALPHSSFNIKTFELSAIAAVDSKNRGFCDEVYVGDADGRLWKITLDAASPMNWRIAQYIDLPLGKIIGQPVIGRHPEGKGEMVYLLIQAHDKRHKIAALTTDKQGALSVSFIIDEHCTLRQFVLRQGYLVVPQDDPHEVNKVKIYDAFTGKKVREAPLVFDTSSLNPHSVAMPFIFMAKPGEKENLIVVNTANGLAAATVEIDYARLGRRSWESLY